MPHVIGAKLQMDFCCQSLRPLDFNHFTGKVQCILVKVQVSHVLKYFLPQLLCTIPEYISSQCVLKHLLLFDNLVLIVYWLSNITSY